MMSILSFDTNVILNSVKKNSEPEKILEYSNINKPTYTITETVTNEVMRLIDTFEKLLDKCIETGYDGKKSIKNIVNGLNLDKYEQNGVKYIEKMFPGGADIYDLGEIRSKIRQVFYKWKSISYIITYCDLRKKKSISINNIILGILTIANISLVDKRHIALFTAFIDAMREGFFVTDDQLKGRTEKILDIENEIFSKTKRTIKIITSKKCYNTFCR